MIRKFNKLFNFVYRKVKEAQNNIASLYQQVFEDNDVQEIIYDIPDALTREVYVQVISKVLACLRKESY